MEIWLVKSNSSLKVDGKTNINSFECIVPSYGKTDTLICQRQSSRPDIFKVESTLMIAIDLFDCHHRIMTRDLQKTLKSDIFPYMVIDFKTLSGMPSEAVQSATFNGKADIILAGVTKTYTITFTSQATNAHNIELVGTKSILFSDFNLKPPSKLGGTIKVKDQLDVEFRLQLKRTL
jgi:hypothetical protein